MAFGGFLQANTAVDLIVGPFVDDTDGKTAETGLAITQAEVRLSKNGANTAQKNEATSLTHDELGNYVCKLDATDTNTEGILTLMIHESGALPIKMDYQVLAQAAYISLITAKDTGYMDVNVKAVSEDTTAADNLESACDNYSATRGLSGTALPAAAADAAGGLPISDAGGLDLDAILADTNELQGDWTNGGRLDLIIDELTTQGDTNEGKLDTIDTVVDAVKAKTDNLPANPADDSDIDAQLAAIAAYLDTEVAAILADTNELQTDLADGGRLDLLIDAILADTNELQTDDYPTSIAAVKADTAAILTDTGTDGVVVSAAAVTAIWAKAMSDLAQGAPSATASVLTAINYLYEAWRNKTETTATRITVYKDDGTTELVRSTISDDATTFTKGEMETGV